MALVYAYKSSGYDTVDYVVPPTTKILLPVLPFCVDSCVQ